jgi:HD-GYP domain-containing protein (c-di-GMP phosphodiesterase class II)
MSAPVQFLTAFAQALSALTLYPEGHRTREHALDAVYERLQRLLEEEPRPVFSFLGEEVVFGHLPLRELRGWDWGSRLATIGVQRLQFDQTATRAEVEEFLEQVLARLTLRAIDTSEARQMRLSGIRFGAVGIKGLDEEERDVVRMATIAFNLGDEAQTVRWIHDELGGARPLPLGEAEAVVRALSVAMHGDQQVMLPLLKLRRYDEYTTTHSMNVSVLAILTSPGDLELPAVVAYEHHIMLNGGGYPQLRYPRDCHFASKLVHVCDVYDALRTKRPYRDAWPMDKVLAYIEERAGAEFDGTMAHAFTQMMRAWEPMVTMVTEDEAIAAT